MRKLTFSLRLERAGSWLNIRLRALASKRLFWKYMPESLPLLLRSSSVRTLLLQPSRINALLFVTSIEASSL